jgi:signal transduction histidine kinase
VLPWPNPACGTTHEEYSRITGTGVEATQLALFAGTVFLALGSPALAQNRLLSGSRNGQQLRLEVDDDGPGIARSDREGVLLRGRQLDEATTGAGLGLAIVGDVAELYRGSLELRSSDLGGLCATLELPATA